ncbi:zinc finger protein 721-like [Hyla sarda]|uniref:zinc finger protein 721-like n=1 Tax=Hyla sarda TaxID=327740 RepID=UPI0024C2AB71|nr:zinc finger protein 721-like [Hyla sarda]
MDSCHGFEVGAEVEFIEGSVVLEDSSTITVENKQDLPAWHHVHYIDESSSDESLGHPSEVKTVTKDQSEMKAPAIPEGLYTGSPLHIIQNNDESVVWDDLYNSEHQDQTCPMEETEISHTEIISAANTSPSPTEPAELYSETILTQEEEEVELLGKYSYYNAKTQCAGTVKPWIRSHKCEKCGRQFGRMYNLERHMCIKKALTKVNMDHMVFSNLSDMGDSDNRCEQSEESMNRLEKMCAEAQKELHNLQGLYKREDEKPLLGISVESRATPTPIYRPLLDGQGFRYRRPFTCERCGRRFRNKFNLGFHVCCGDKNMSAPQNTIVIKPENSIATNLLGQSDQTNSNLEKPPGKSKVPEGTEIFKCQLCGKEYTKQAYYRSHMRWHMKERDLICSVNKSISADNVDHLLTNIDMTSIGLKKKSGPTFTCQECGRIFNKQCSFSTHTLWHHKRNNAASEPSVSQVVEGQEMKTQEAQVPSISAQHKDSDGTKAVPDTFNCPECGRVFFKRIAYANHSRWHVKERELALSVKAATQANAIGHQLNSSQGGSSEDRAQSYSNLVKHVNLGERQSFYIEEGTVDNSAVESGQSRASTAVPEFVWELEVGTESVHEDLVSKASEVSETVGDVEETTTRTQTGPLTSPTEETNERPAPLSRVLPYKLLGRQLKRPRPPYRCRDCGTCFSGSWKLKSHQYKSKVLRSRCKKHRCDCGRSVLGSLHYLRHQLGHLSDTAFICAVCGQVLRGYQKLRAHSWVHPLVSQFQCKCGARFTQLPKYLWHSLLNKTAERGRRKQKSHPKRLGDVCT